MLVSCNFNSFAYNLPLTQLKLLGEFTSYLSNFFLIPSKGYIIFKVSEFSQGHILVRCNMKYFINSKALEKIFSISLMEMQAYNCKLYNRGAGKDSIALVASYIRGSTLK
jgi:hypothetical protein